MRETKVVAHLGGENARVGEDDVFLMLRSSDFDPVTRADLPAALQSLGRGDAAPFVHLFVRDTGDEIRTFESLRHELQAEDMGYSTSRFLATACLEARLPWSPASALSTRKAATKAYLRRLGKRPFAPFLPSLVTSTGVGPDCSKWPATPVPDPPPAVAPDVPVLVISGRDDIRTPLEGAQVVAAAFPHATLLTVPHVGHSVLTTDEDHCALNGAAAFLTGQPVAPCATKPTVPAGAYYPAAFGGDAKQAANTTIAALQHDVEAATAGSSTNRRIGLAGLRGGFAIARRGALDLRKVSQFTGLRMSGKLSEAGNGKLTLSGKRTGTVVMRNFKAQAFRPSGR